MNHQKEIEIVEKTAAVLKGYGYTVYVSANRRYGFYTDGHRVVDFSPSIIALNFSGNYEPSYSSGTGWIIAEDAGFPTREEAAGYVIADAPTWANKAPIYTTPAMYLKKSASWAGYAIV